MAGSRQSTSLNGLVPVLYVFYACNKFFEIGHTSWQKGYMFRISVPDAFFRYILRVRYGIKRVVAEKLDSPRQMANIRDGTAALPICNVFYANVKSFG